jgi:hypothetical protein
MSASGSFGSYSSSEVGTSSGSADFPLPLSALSPLSRPPIFGMVTVDRTSWTLESSTPVAPQPGHDKAPLRCLRQVLQ